MANHAICLLTYVAEHPDEIQSYRSLSAATGIPYSTIWELTHWKHFMASTHGEPLYVWAWNLGYEVTVVGREDLVLIVTKRDIWDEDDEKGILFVPDE